MSNDITRKFYISNTLLTQQNLDDEEAYPPYQLLCKNSLLSEERKYDNIACYINNGFLKLAIR